MMTDKTSEVQKSNTTWVKGKTPDGAIPWQPGQSGNPAGRPPNKRYLSELAREMLKETKKGDLSGKTTDELVVLALVKQALRGDTKAIGMLHDWTEGKVADTHKFEGDVPFSIVFKQVKREEDDAVQPRESLTEGDDQDVEGTS